MTMLINTLADFRRAARVGPYTDLGGYDTFFITSDGACLCFDCTMKERHQVIWSIAHNVNDGWRVTGLDAVCNTDGPVMCDHCGLVILDDPDAMLALAEKDDEDDDTMVEYTLPAFWASYLINGDATGLEDWEQHAIDLWIATRRLGSPISVSDETWFAKYSDSGAFGGDVATYTFNTPTPEDDTPRLKCDQCQMLTINGVTCHELRCPNFRSRWDAETGSWIKQRTCAVCGYAYDANEMCCDGDEDPCEEY